MMQLDDPVDESPGPAPLVVQTHTAEQVVAFLKILRGLSRKIQNSGHFHGRARRDQRAIKNQVRSKLSQFVQHVDITELLETVLLVCPDLGTAGYYSIRAYLLTRSYVWMTAVSRDLAIFRRVTDFFLRHQGPGQPALTREVLDQ